MTNLSSNLAVVLTLFTFMSSASLIMGIATCIAFKHERILLGFISIIISVIVWMLMFNTMEPNPSFMLMALMLMPVVYFTGVGLLLLFIETMEIINSKVDKNRHYAKAIKPTYSIPNIKVNRQKVIRKAHINK